MAFFNALKSKLLRLNNRVDDYHEAITFSEAGAHDYVMGKQESTCSENKGKNLVVASHDSRFSDDIITYALEMAARMNYGIIAVNAANLTHDVTEFFSSTHDKLFQEFKEIASQNVEGFRAKALEQKLNFAHSVQYSTVDNAISTITKECGEIEFVISENRTPAPLRGSVQNEKRIAQRLCVYSLN
ncbi:MAG: hypothetical protein V1793_08500 [Pseudomonadota bacterium]